MPPTANELRTYYETSAQLTAGPADALLMLYDRLLLDLTRADRALAGQRTEEAHHALVEAQQIVAGLRGILDPGRWPAGEGLGQVYDFLRDTLVQVNLAKDPAALAPCRKIVSQLAAAWATAATQGVPASAGRVA